MVREFDPTKNRVDRQILLQVLDARTKVVGGGLVINSERGSSINNELHEFKEDPGP